MTSMGRPAMRTGGQGQTEPGRERSTGPASFATRFDSDRACREATPIDGTGCLRGSVTLWPMHLCALTLLCVFAGVFTAGCRQDMHDQPKFIPLRESTFFTDQRSARPVVAGTVARGQLHDDPLLFTGKMNGADTEIFPFAIDERVLRRGRERFDIYCSPCHARTGEGDGMIVRRGYRRPPSLHDERLRTVAVGHFFDVITNGFGAMPDYSAQVTPADRWAIAAYVRALQLSAHATLADVPPADRAKLDQAPAGGR
jgi:mono/diheme cytochrome c family protein